MAPCNFELQIYKFKIDGNILIYDGGLGRLTLKGSKYLFKLIYKQYNNISKIND